MKTPLVRRLIAVAAAVGDLILLSVLLSDVGGWGVFVLDIATSTFVQLLLSALLSGLLLAIYAASARPLRLLISRYLWLGVFTLTSILSLLLLPVVLDRRIDLYDGIQTAFLIVVFSLVSRPVERFLQGRPGDVIHPGLEDFKPWPGSGPPRSPLSVDAALYHDLLTKVGGDVGRLERLIEYERRLVPLAGETELYERAIRRWERDNQ